MAERESFETFLVKLAAKIDRRQRHLREELAQSLAPSRDECRRMLRGLGHRQEDLACMLGVRQPMVSRWLSGKAMPSYPSRKAIWLLHALKFRPWILQSWRGVAFWGSLPAPPPVPAGLADGAGI